MNHTDVVWLVAVLGCAGVGGMITWRSYARLHGRPAAMAAVLSPWLVVGLAGSWFTVTGSLLGAGLMLAATLSWVFFDRQLFYWGGGPKLPDSLGECVTILSALASQRRLTQRDGAAIEALLVAMRMRIEENPELVERMEEIIRYYLDRRIQKSQEEVGPLLERIRELHRVQLLREAAG